MQTSFFKNKVQRQIKYNGQRFPLIKVSEDKYHQKGLSNPVEIEFEGLYHESISYISISGADAGRMRSKPQPMILTLYDDYKTANIKVDDIILIGDNKYKVTGATDIKNLHVACDISLELIV